MSLSFVELRDAIKTGKLKPSQVLLAYQAKVNTSSIKLHSDMNFECNYQMGYLICFYIVARSSSQNKLHHRIHQGSAGITIFLAHLIESIRCAIAVES